MLIPIILLDSYKKDNFYKDIIYYKESETIGSPDIRKKIIWLIFDQYDYNIINKNIEKFQNIK